MLDLCDCECHKDGVHIKHIMPCCVYCELCYKMIKRNYMFLHEAKCKEDHKKLD